MWLSIMSFIGGPVISGLISAYREHLKATTTDKQTASSLAGQEIAAQTAETQAITQLKVAQIGHPFEPEKIAFYIVMIFFAKCIVWDTVLGLGTTPPLRGDVSVWAGMVIGFYFTKRGAENVTTIIKAFR